VQSLKNKFPISHSSIGILSSQIIDDQEDLPKSNLQKYWTLPRLYVGPHRDCSFNASLQSALGLGVRIPLSAEQTHYLIKVMRLLKKRKGKKEQDMNDDDDVQVSRDCIRIFDGRSGEWLAKVHVQASFPEENNATGGGKGRGGKKRPSSKKKEDVTLFAECLRQLKPIDLTAEERRPWVLFAPLKKQQRMKNMVEKCTEIGVGAMIPIVSDRVEGDAVAILLGTNGGSDGPSDSDALYGGTIEETIGFGVMEKLELQAIEASEQCERVTIPILSKYCPMSPFRNVDKVWKLRDILEIWGRNDDNHNRVLMICRERGSDEEAKSGRSKVLPILQALRSNRQVALLVGPEGGWSLEEETIFDDFCSRLDGEDEQRLIQCVSLGSSVLRAETACMIAVGAWALMHDSNN